MEIQVEAGTARHEPSIESKSQKGNQFTFGVNGANVPRLEENSSSDRPNAMRPSSQENSRNGQLKRKEYVNDEAEQQLRTLDQRQMSSPNRSSQNHSKTHNKMESLRQSAELVRNSLPEGETKPEHYTTRNSEDQKESIVKIKDESVFVNPSEKARIIDDKTPFEQVKFNMTMQTF